MLLFPHLLESISPHTYKASAFSLIHHLSPPVHHLNGSPKIMTSLVASLSLQRWRIPQITIGLPGPQIPVPFPLSYTPPTWASSTPASQLSPQQSPWSLSRVGRVCPHAPPLDLCGHISVLTPHLCLHSQPPCAHTPHCGKLVIPKSKQPSSGQVLSHPTCSGGLGMRGRTEYSQFYCDPIPLGFQTL